VTKLTGRRSYSHIGALGLAVALSVAIYFAVARVVGGSSEHAARRAAASRCAGVSLKPGDSIQAAVNRHPENTVFCLADGTYTAQQVYPRSGDSFISDSGRAKLDGRGKTFAFRADASDPSNVTIRGLEISGYRSEKQWGVIDGDLAGGRRVTKTSPLKRSTKWQVLFCNIHDNGGTSTGVRVGSKSLVRGNKINHNGMMGVGGTGDGTIWEYNEIGWNNTAHNDYGFEAGGAKFAATTNAVVRNNYVHDNYGPGFWSDISNRNLTYYGNAVTDNISTGILHEISYRAEIANNYIARNSIGNVRWLYGDGILLSTSQDVGVHDNWLEDNAMGVIMTQARRGGDWKTANNHVYNNHIASRSGYTGLSQQDPGPDVRRAGNYFNGNHYYTDQSVAWFWLRPMDFKTWRENGQDRTGDVKPRSAWPGRPRMAVGPGAYPGDRTGTQPSPT
jgi:Right handed beta helix region